AAVRQMLDDADRQPGGGRVPALGDDRVVERVSPRDLHRLKCPRGNRHALLALDHPGPPPGMADRPVSPVVFREGLFPRAPDGERPDVVATRWRIPAVVLAVPDGREV